MPPLDAKEFIYGGGAAYISIVSTFPLNKLMFRQQLEGISLQRAFEQLRMEGIVKLYRGVLPPMILKTTTSSIMFGTFNFYQNALSTIFEAETAQNKMAAAFLSGSTEAMLCPLERIQTLLQVKDYHMRFQNTFHAFSELTAYGPKEFYRGLSAILLRNGSSNVLFFMWRGHVKKKRDQSSSATKKIMEDLVSGGMLGALISTIFYPVNVVKTRMQSTVGSNFKSFSKTARLIWKEREGSIIRIYRGVHINFTRSLISWAIITASYEILKEKFAGKADL